MTFYCNLCTNQKLQNSGCNFVSECIKTGLSSKSGSGTFGFGSSNTKKGLSMAQRQTNIEQGFDKEATPVGSTRYSRLLALLEVISQTTVKGASLALGGAVVRKPKMWFVAVTAAIAFCAEPSAQGQSTPTTQPTGNNAPTYTAGHETPILASGNRLTMIKTARGRRR